MSAREAARRAGISEGLWRQVAGGYVIRRGRVTRVNGPDGTVAAMAAAVGVTPAQLAAAGRPDAAAALLDLLARREADVDALIGLVPRMSAAQAARLLAEIGARLRASGQEIALGGGELRQTGT
jgi:hypothetical protein